MPYVYIEESKLEEIINNVGPTLDDLKSFEPFVGASNLEEIIKKARNRFPTLAEIKKAAPFRPWYESKSYDAATISFGDRAEGVVVEIRDARASHSKDIRDEINIREGSIEIPTRAVAAMCRGHIKAITGEKRALIFNTDLPAPLAPIEDWVKWIEAMNTKNVDRLRQGIWHFRTQEIEQGND